MRICLVLVVALAALALGACGGEAMPEGRPEDLTARYEWVAGSMPPPHHYEYTISIGPGTKGSMTMVPNYEGIDPQMPTWSEEFDVAPADLDRFYALLLQQDVFERAWKRSDEMGVGGDLEHGAFSAAGKSVNVPADLEGSDQSAIAPVYEALKALVPRAVWDDLMARRDQYAETYGE